MPTPRKGETRAAFVKRAVPVIKKEYPGKAIRAVLGQAYGMYDNAKKKR